MSYRYIPELDYYFRSYWLSRGEITIDNINIPIVDSENQELPTGSFLQLLFSQTFDSTSYTYLFSETEVADLSKSLEERFKVSGSTTEVYMSTSSSSGENIFSLEDNDLTLLSKLSSYRIGINPNISNINYDNLSTNLSKLIYIYLDLVLNKNYSVLNDSSVISDDDNALESLFELYVINESYKVMKNWTNLIDANLLELRLVHEVKTITSTIEAAKAVSLDEVVYDYNLDVYHNGEKLVQDTDYIVAIDSTSGDSTAVVTWVVWENKEANIVEDDVLVIEYYTKVTSADVGTNVYVDNVEFQGGG